MVNFKKYLPKRDSIAGALMFASVLIGASWTISRVVNRQSEEKSHLNLQQVWFDSEKRHSLELDNLLINLDAPEGLESVLSPAYDSQAVFVGEDHGDSSDDLVFGNYVLPLLNREGFKVLGLELDSSCQKIVDKYMDSKITLDQMAQSLLESNNHHNKYFLNLYSFSLLIGKAKQLGIAVHCVDNSYSLDGSSQSGWYMREKLSLDKIDNQIFKKNPNSKLIVFYGAAHGPKMDDYSSILSNLGVIWGRNPLDYCQTLGDRLKERLSGGKDGDPVFVINLTDRELPGYDIDLSLRIIVLPQSIADQSEGYEIMEPNQPTNDLYH